MRSWVIIGLLLSIALAGASYVIGSNLPDGLETALGPEAPREASPARNWRRGLLGAAGVVIVFTAVVGLGALRGGRRRAGG